MTVGMRCLAVFAASCAAAFPAVIGVPAHLGHEPTAATSAGQPASETVVHIPAGTLRHPPDTTGPHGTSRDTVSDQQDDGHGRAVANGLTASGIPAVALRAYHAAADATARTMPSCGVDWALLAAIGMVESDHGRHAGSALGPDGTDRPPVYGPVLTRIADTDGGGLDGGASYERAVGPMQFIPGTWRIWAVDGNGDGVADPQNVYDAALAAAHYLCAGGTDVAANPGLAVFRYNHSPSYVALVLALAAAYRTGGAVNIPGSGAGFGGGYGSGSGDGSGSGSGGGSGPRPTRSVSPSAPGSPSAKPSPTPSKSGSSPSPTKSGSSPTPTKSSPTPSPTKSSSHTPTPSPTKSSTPTPSPSSSSPEPTTSSPKPTQTTCPSPTASGGKSPSPSPTECTDSEKVQGRALSAALLAAPAANAPTPTTSRPRSPSPTPDQTVRPPASPTPRPTPTATPSGAGTGAGTTTGTGSGTTNGPGLRPTGTDGLTTRTGYLDDRPVPDPIVAPTPGGAGWFGGRGPGGSAPSLPSDRPAPLPHLAAVTGFAAQYAAAGRSDLVTLLPRAVGVHLRVLDHVRKSTDATPARAPPERSPP